MKKPECLDEDYDYKSEYQDHKCSIDFHAAVFHDRSELKSIATLEDFLSDYRNISTLEIPDDFPPENMERITMDATDHLCQHCNHSSYNVSKLSERTYHLPDRTKSTVCPLQDDFTTGTYFKLGTYSQEKMKCSNPDCPNPSQLKKVSPDGSSPLELHDILFQGSPTVIEVKRTRYKCSSCNRRILVQPIEEIEIAPRLQLSVRLIKAIYERSVSSPGGISLPAEKAVAEGYAINRRQLSAYLAGERKELVESYLKKRADTIKLEHASSPSSYSSAAYYCTTVSLSESQPLVLFCREVFDEEDFSTLFLHFAFDGQFYQTAEKWISGEFGSDYYAYRALDESRLTIFSHYYAAAKHSDYAFSYYFYCVRLILLYGRTVCKAPNLRSFILTKTLSEFLSEDDFSYPPKVKGHAEDIYIFASYSCQDELAQAAKDLIDYISTNSRYCYDYEKNIYFTSRFPGSNYIERKETGSYSEIDALVKALQADFGALSKYAVEQSNWEQYYQTSIELVIQRLMFFNEVAVTSALKNSNDPFDELCEEDGTLNKNIDFSSGIPVYLLCEYIRDRGLFSSERFKKNPDWSDNRRLL